MPDQAVCLPPASSAMAPFNVGSWRVDPTLNRIRQRGREIKLEPRVMHVLVCLASRPAQVVTREELMEVVWAGTIVSEEAVTIAISVLRRSLGDVPRDPQFIETIHKIGYRLIAPVTTAREAPVRRARRPVWLAAPLLLILGLAMWLWVGRREQEPEALICAGVPITTYPGDERYPALSPDGTRVAFAWAGEEGVNSDIYVKQPGAELPLRLTHHQASESFPAWSPDGSTIAYVRTGRRWGIHTIPAIGGTPQLVVSTAPGVYGLDWSPDGRFLVFSGPHEPGNTPAIVMVSVETGETSFLTSPQPPYTCDFSPAFSPDGSRVGFVRTGPQYQQDVYVVPTTGGTPERVTHYQRQVTGFDWMPDGRELIFAAAPSGEYSLWRIDLASGDISWLPTQGGAAMQPTIARGARRLVYERLQSDYGIWQVQLDDSTHQAGRPTPLIASTRIDYGARFSPDGEQIVFISTRSGTREIWTCDAQGRHLLRLTDFGDTFVLHPRWSPDSREIAFSATMGENAAAFIVGVDGGKPRRVRRVDGHDIVSGWSPDGEWLYVESNAGGDWRLCQMRPDGSSARVITEADRSLVGVADGYLYMHRPAVPGVWRRPIEGGEEECVADADVASDWAAIAVMKGGIYFIWRNPGVNTIGYYDLADRSPQYVVRLPMDSPRLAVSPDETTFLFEHEREREIDLILIDDFR